MSLGKAAARIAAAGTAAGFATGLWSLAEAQAFALRRRTLVLDPRASSADASVEPVAGGSTASEPKASVRGQSDALDPPFSAPAKDAVSLDDGDPRRLRVLHLSDIHLLAWQRRKLAWIEKLADEGPDLLVLTGDSIAHSAAVAPLLRTLSVFAGLPGLFVFGSNDYYYPKLKNPFRYFARDTAPRAGELEERPQLPWREMAAAFEQAGWLNLSNTRGSLRIDGWNLDFVGVDDPHLGYDRFPKGRGDSADEVGAAPKATDVRIGVAHAPYARVLDAMVDDGCSIVFAGHTHGGQVCLPGKGALVTNCDMPVELAAGLFEWPEPGEVIRYDGFAPTLPGHGRRAWVNISAGLGTSPLAPVRVACRPEAVLLDLVVI